MRRRIKLTGRKKLPKASVNANLFEVSDGKLVVAMSLAGKYFAGMPPTARVKLRLFENKVSETLEFGTLDDLKTTADIESGAFSVPSCELRVVGADPGDKGKVLGSTDSTWKLSAGGENRKEAARKSILQFEVGDIAPHCWKLDVRDDQHPVLYVDKSIPEPFKWVRVDPVFNSCVLPAVIRELFGKILATDSPSEREWETDWLNWANALEGHPPWKGDFEEKQDWIGDLVSAFCARHNMLGELIDELGKERPHD